jgi:transcriptional regulator with XRE-family HTH domain
MYKAVIRQNRQLMKFNITMTGEEVLQEAGKRLAMIRLSRNITQLELSQKAGVSKRSLERLEAGVSGLRLDVFFSVCVALRLAPGLETLLPEVELMPQDILRNKTLPKRARKKRISKTQLWGDES